METSETISSQTDEKHTKLMAFMRAWAKRKQDKQTQIWKDYEDGKYDDWLVQLNKKHREALVTY